MGSPRRRSIADAGVLRRGQDTRGAPVGRSIADSEGMSPVDRIFHLTTDNSL